MLTRMIYVLLSAVAGITLGIAVYNATGMLAAAAMVGWWCLSTGVYVAAHDQEQEEQER